MKKIFTIVIVLLLTVTVNVYAEDYNILVDENNNFTLKDSSNNPVTDNSIAKYENNTLTLGENTTFNEIKTKHDLTITSNNKEVSIKNLTTKEGNTYLPVNVNINKLKVKDDETYYFQIDVGGYLTINNSETNSQKDTEVKGYIDIKDSRIKNIKSINSRDSNDDGYGLIITNSEITSDNQIRPANGGSYLKDSMLNVKYIYSMGNFIIDNCEINTSYLTLNRSGEYKVDIKNSTIHDSGQLYLNATGLDNIMTIENSTIECTSISGESPYNVAGNIPASLELKDSTIVIKNGLSMGGELLSIDNTDLTMGYLTYDGKTTIIKKSKINVTTNYVRSNIMEITDSKVFIKNYIQGKKLTIENSDVELEFLYGNSNPDQDIEYNAVITNSKTVVHSFLSGPSDSNFLFKNSDISFEKGVRQIGKMKLVNSTGQMNEGVTINKDLILEDSILKLKNEEEDKTALFVENDLKIKNSNIIIDNNTIDKVAAIVKNNVVLDDRIVPIDDSKTILKVKELTKEEIIALMPNYDSQIADNTNVKIFTYNDDSYSKYVQLATTKTISFRVKNGTWLDGTTDDIKLDYLYGEKIDVENLPEEVKKLLTSKMGEWSVDLYNLDPTKDQEIEFKYNIVNPETARNYIIMILAILAVTILLKRQISIRKGLVN